MITNPNLRHGGMFGEAAWRSNKPPRERLSEPGRNGVAARDGSSPGPRSARTRNAGDLLRTRWTLISTGTELSLVLDNYREGSVWAQLAYPRTLGYSAVADVVEVGPEVTSIRTGDTVAAPTWHVRLAVAHEDSVIVMRDGRVPLELGTFVTLGRIVMNAVRRSRVVWGESVVVFGAGLLGQLAVRFCRLVGARPVIGVDVAADRLARLP
jgi:threonine dehydrogenase-like Zn-dependent dehydrogenase